MLDKNLTDQIREIFKKEPEVLAVYCFGSFAKGKASSQSDFDLAFVVDDKKSTSLDRIYELIRNLKFPKDLDLSLVDKSSSPLFLYEIITNGKRIYERDKQEITLFEAYILKNYYDNSHMRQIYYQYLKEKFPLKPYVSQ